MTTAAPSKDKDGKAVPQAPGAVLRDLGDALAAVRNDIAELKQKAATPVYPGAHPGQVLYGSIGPLTRDSGGYSILKAVGYAMGYIDAEQAKEEIAFANRLRALYCKHGFGPAHARSFVVPFDTSKIPTIDQEGERLAAELRFKMAAGRDRVDPDEQLWLNKKLGGLYTKALGTITDTAGGVLVGFPTLGELVDLQRNRETFANAGAQEVPLPPNGRIQYPKLANGATAFFIGEGAQIPESQQQTGDLDLQAKKLGIFVKINNEAVRFVNPSMEALVRNDMARVGALAIDLSMLEGTGGSQILGILNYPTTTSWATGTDKVIAHTVTANKFQPEDAALMEGKLPDAVDAPSAWVMRKNMWAVIQNRRADAVTAADNKGPFVFNLTRQAGDMPALELYGTKVVRSSQVSNTRPTGARTFILLGYFPDWIVGRFGIMEFLASTLGDSPMQFDQTWVRGIQHVDAGARHAASFVLADQVDIL